MTVEHDNPWLTISLADYEGHMEAVGQAAALRSAFSEIYRSVKPRRLAVLGCTSGGDFELVDPMITEDAVGVDINQEYLRVAEARAAGLPARVRYVCGDVLSLTLPPASFDLVHAALVLEYLDQGAFFRRVRGWLRPAGRLSVVSQEPLAGVAAVTATAYTSLQALAPRMSLRSAQEIAAEGAAAGLARQSMRMLELAGGKILAHSVFMTAG